MVRTPIAAVVVAVALSVVAPRAAHTQQSPATPETAAAPGGAVQIALSANALPLPTVDSARMARAMELLDAMHYDSVLHQSIGIMLDAQLEANPLLKDYRDVLEQFFDRYMSMEHVGPPTAALYAARFSEQELRELIGFYSTPLGQKVVDLTPELTQAGVRIGQEIVRQHSAELMMMMSQQHGTPAAAPSGSGSLR